MLELASLGAKVLQIRSVELGMKYGVRIHVRSSFSDVEGTWVVPEETSMEKVVVSGVTASRDEAKITLEDLPDTPGIAARCSQPLADASISVDMIVQNQAYDGTTDLTFTVPQGDRKRAVAILTEKVPDLVGKDGERISFDDEICKVSVVGVGMRSHAGVAKTMFELLSKESINIQLISTCGDQDLLRDRAQVRRARRAHVARRLRLVAAAFRARGAYRRTMGGCTNCKGKSGCDDRKGSMMQSVDEALEQLYPSHTWGEAEEPRDPNHAGMPEDELAALAEELATELRAATFVRTGGDDEPCDFIYVLALGRAPCIVQVRDHGVAVPDEWADAVRGDVPARRDQPARARRGRPAGRGHRACADGDHWLVRESPRAGVYDAPLLARMQKLVAILPAYDLLHVDFGEIAHAPARVPRRRLEGRCSAASLRSRTTCSIRQPTTMITTSLIG